MPEVYEYRLTEAERKLREIEKLPTDVALLVKSVESLESRFKNLQRGFYFFGTCVVGASITFGITALRVFSVPSESHTLSGLVLRGLGVI